MNTENNKISTIYNDQLEKLVYKKPIVKPLTAKATRSLVNDKKRIMNKVLIKTFNLLNMKNRLDIFQIFARKVYKRNKWFSKEKRRKYVGRKYFSRLRETKKKFRGFMKIKRRYKKVIRNVRNRNFLRFFKNILKKRNFLMKAKKLFVKPVKKINYKQRKKLKKTRRKVFTKFKTRKYVVKLVKLAIVEKAHKIAEHKMDRKLKRSKMNQWMLKQEYPVYDPKPFNTLKEKKLGIELLANTNIHLGTRLTKFSNSTIEAYYLATRVEHIVYNLNILTYSLRHVFKLIALYYTLKLLMLVNIITYESKLSTTFEDHIKSIAKKRFLFTFKKWIGGSITNFKHLYKQIYSSHKLAKNTEASLLPLLNKKKELNGLRVKKLPKLASLYFSLGDLHWGLNEAKALELKTIQACEITHRNYFGEINLAVSLAQSSLKTMVSFIRETLIFGKKANKRFFGSLLQKTAFNRFLKKKRSKKLKKRLLLKKRSNFLSSLLNNFRKKNKPFNFSKHVKIKPFNVNKQGLKNKPFKSIKNSVKLGNSIKLVKIKNKPSLKKRSSKRISLKRKIKIRKLSFLSKKKKEKLISKLMVFAKTQKYKLNILLVYLVFILVFFFFLQPRIIISLLATVLFGGLSKLLQHQDKSKVIPVFNYFIKYKNFRTFIIKTYNYAEKLITNPIYLKYGHLSSYCSLLFLSLRLFALYGIYNFDLSLFSYFFFGFHGIFRLYTNFSFVVHKIYFKL